MDVRLLDVDRRDFSIGRAVILIGVNASYDPDTDGPVTIADTERWDGTGPLRLAHLGNTLGDVEVNVDEEESRLTLEEFTGPMAHEIYYDGENVMVEMPLFAGEPRIRALVSPTGSASSGFGRQRPKRKHTLVVMPEQVMFNQSLNGGLGGFGDLTWSAVDGFEVDGESLSAEQQRLFNMSLWIWNGAFQATGDAFSHADGGRRIQPVMFEGIYSPEFPDGHRLYTRGIDIGEIDLSGL